MNKREINKLEREMQTITTLIIHTPDKKAKMLYADKLLEITPMYLRLVYHSQEKRTIHINPKLSPDTYFYEGGCI